MGATKCGRILEILAETEDELLRRWVEWQVTLEKKMLKLDATKTEVMVCII